MGIFDRDRIGTSVYCKVVDDEGSVGHGYVKWVLAKEGQVVNSLEVLGYGRVKYPYHPKASLSPRCPTTHIVV